MIDSLVKDMIDATDNWNPPPLVIEYKEDGDMTAVCQSIRLYNINAI